VTVFLPAGVLTYTGDTEWVDTLLAAGHDADLLIAEAYCFERKVRFHLDYVTLREKLPMIGAKRLILTHMSPDMLGRVSSGSRSMTTGPCLPSPASGLNSKATGAPSPNRSPALTSFMAF
jgi:hypothetical protein